MKNKFLAALLVSATCLAGCSGTTGDQTATEAQTKASVSETTSEKQTTSENVKDETTEPASQESVTQEPETKEPETKEPETTKDDISGILDGGDTNPTLYVSTVIFNLNSIKYTIPSDYRVMYDENIGPIVYLPNVFQMKLVSREGSFDDILADVDSIDDKALSIGYNSVLAPTTSKINGRTYAYFIIEADGEQTLAILTEGLNANTYIGAQIAILSDTVKSDDLLKMYASILDKAVATSEADSSEEAITSQIRYISGKKLTSSDIAFNSKSVNFKVPDGYYYTSDLTSSDGQTQFFSCAKFDMSVSIYQKAFAEDTAEYSIDAMLLFDSNAKKSVETVGDYTVYICTTSYENGDRTYYEIMAKADINDEYTFTVSADCRDTGAISFDEIRTFFEIKE